MQRFTPRKPGSIWSAVNIAKVEALEKAGRIAPAGRDAFAIAIRRTGLYSFENRNVALAPDLERRRAQLIEASRARTRLPALSGQSASKKGPA